MKISCDTLPCQELSHQYIIIVLLLTFSEYFREFPNHCLSVWKTFLQKDMHPYVVQPFKKSSKSCQHYFVRKKGIWRLIYNSFIFRQLPTVFIILGFCLTISYTFSIKLYENQFTFHIKWKHKGCVLRCGVRYLRHDTQTTPHAKMVYNKAFKVSAVCLSCSRVTCTGVVHLLSTSYPDADMDKPLCDNGSSVPSRLIPYPLFAPAALVVDAVNAAPTGWPMYQAFNHLAKGCYPCLNPSVPFCFSKHTTQDGYHIFFLLVQMLLN